MKMMNHQVRMKALVRTKMKLRLLRSLRRQRVRLKRKLTRLCRSQERLSLCQRRMPSPTVSLLIKQHVVFSFLSTLNPWVF